MFWILDALIGAVLAAGLVAVARRAGRAELPMLAAGLFVAALLYPIMGARTHALAELPAELAGLAVFTLAAGLGARAWPALLALGWGLHAVYDLALPVLADTAYVPVWYAPACLGFDLVVAAAVWTRVGAGPGPAAKRARATS